MRAIANATSAKNGGVAKHSIPACDSIAQREEAERPTLFTADEIGQRASETSLNSRGGRFAMQADTMSKTKNPEEIYTDPELREKIKDELMAGDKGGKPGEWSARKSQMLVREYEEQGGGYLNQERTESQKSLQEWTDEDWQTSDGKVAIRGDDKTERYLPRAAWDKLTATEKKAANLQKEKGTKAGEQTVEWTDAVKRVMKELDDEK